LNDGKEEEKKKRKTKEDGETNCIIRYPSLSVQMTTEKRALSSAEKVSDDENERRRIS
jgi:hypothetical protein